MIELWSCLLIVMPSLYRSSTDPHIDAKARRKIRILENVLSHVARQKEAISLRRRLSREELGSAGSKSRASSMMTQSKRLRSCCAKTLAGIVKTFAKVVYRSAANATCTDWITGHRLPRCLKPCLLLRRMCCTVEYRLPARSVSTNQRRWSGRFFSR